MEYFLKNNIMGGMYDIGQLTFPSGIFQQITKTFGQLVQELDRKFLVHSSVHIPILKLLKTAMFSAEMSATTEREVVHLMFTISCRLLEYPDLLSIFFHQREFLGVSPSGGVEVKRRTSSDPTSRNNNEVRAHEFQVSENSEYDYPLFLYLLHFVHYDGQTGDYARTALIFCLQTATPTVDDFILRYSGFSLIMVTALGGRFSSLSTQYVGSDAEESLSKFLNSLEFYQKAVVEASPSVARDLVENFKVYFLLRIVHPKMAGGDTMTLEITATTTYVDRMLQVITEENLSRYFVELLVSDSLEALLLPHHPESGSTTPPSESQGGHTPTATSSSSLSSSSKAPTSLKITTSLSHLEDAAPLDSPVFSFGAGLTQPLSDLVPTLVPGLRGASSHNLLAVTSQGRTSLTHDPLKRVLLLRLNHPNHEIQEATWQLFHTMVSLHRILSVTRLLKNTFDMLNTLEMPAKTEKIHAEEIKRYFEIFPTAQAADYEVVGYEFYLSDILEIVNPTQPSKTQKKAAAPSSTPHKGKQQKGKDKHSVTTSSSPAAGSSLMPERASQSGRRSPTPGSGRKSPISFLGRRSPVPPKHDDDESEERNPPAKANHHHHHHQGESGAIVDPLTQELHNVVGDSSEPDEFLEIVLARLETFTTNTFDSNLMITGIFTQLTCFPDPRLTEFILHSDNLHKRYLLSLYSILSRVSQEMAKSLQT